jgi:hypothetical protein
LPVTALTQPPGRHGEPAAGPSTPSALKKIYWQVSAGFGVPGEYLPHYLFLVQQYWLNFGQLRLFIRPRSFNELLYRKMLRARDPRMKLATEKVSARDYVASKVGSDCLVPLFHVGEDPAQIPFRDLPQQFVIKASHGSGFVVIVTDKSTIDHTDVAARVRRWLELDWYRLRREWAYQGIPRRVLVEKLLLEQGELPANYKFHVFNGRARFVTVGARTPLIAGVYGDAPPPPSSYFDENWRPLAVRRRRPLADPPPERPSNFPEMRELAEKLAEDFEFCRVDLYSVDGHIYFGEITQYPHAGLGRFSPGEFDLALGEVWRNGTPIPPRFYRNPAVAS